MPRTVITRSSTSGGGRTVVHRAAAAQGGGRTTVQPYRNPVTGLTQQTGNPVKQLEKATAQRGPGPLMGPIGAVLDFVSQPAYAVGSALQGHPLEAARHLAQLVPVVQAAEHIPGISGPAKAALSPRENILPADVSYIRHGIEAIPNRYARAGVGLVANVAGDPLTYVTFGAGGIARNAASTAAWAEIRAASDAVMAASKAHGAGTAAFEDVARTAARHAEATQALRQARGPGVHASLQVPFVRRAGRELGTVPLSRTTARGAGWVGRQAQKSERVQQATKGLRGEFRAGGEVAAHPSYQGWNAVRRAAATEKQRIAQQAGDLDKRFTARVKELAGKGAKDLTGQPLTAEKAYRDLAHHLEQPAKFAVPKGLEDFATEARGLFDHYNKLEAAAGIEYKMVENYVPHILSDVGQRKEFIKRFVPPNQGLRSAFFVHSRHVPTLEQLESFKDPATGKQLFTPETNVAKLIEVRGKAHVDEMAKQGAFRALGERHGVHAPARPPVDVGASALELDAARARLATAKEVRPTWTQQTAVASARQDIGAAQAGAKAAGKQPYFAAQMRATRGLVQARQLRDVIRPVARAGEGAVETPAGAVQVSSVEHGQQILTDARRAVEKARKRAAAAQRLKDPVAIKQARQQLTRAIHTHMDARIALAAARGRTVGSVTEVERATRGVLQAQTGLATAERQAARVVAENRRLAKLPGRAAAPEEWAAIQKEWQKVPGRFNRGVHVDPEAAGVIQRITHEIGRQMERPEDVMAIRRFAQNLTGRWKSLALLSPGYHARNLQGDAMLAWWAGGRNPVSYAQSARLLRRDPRLTGITIRGKRYSTEEFLNLARSQGIVGQGFAATEVRSVQEGLRGRRLGPIPLELPGTGPASRLSQRVGQRREDAFRLGTFIERLKQGDDVISAANRTHEFHLDYGHVSDFIDQSRKFWLPFVTYMSKAAPLTVKQIARRPGFFSHYAAATEASNQAAGQPQGLEGLPVGGRMSFAIPAPGAVRGLLGAKGDEPLIWNPEGVLPIGTPNQLDPNQFQREVMQLLNPLVKTPIELKTGHRFYYAGDAPKLARATGPVALAHRLLGPVADPLLGITRKSDGSLGYSPTVDALLRLAPSYSRLSGVTNTDTGRLAQGLSSWGLGIRLTPYDRAKAIANAQKYAGR